MPEIGATLREARMRARIDISEIEAETKIRAKYLRALENEEWDLLPGPAYVKSFLRTYAEALGLDAKLLVEEYKLRYERPSERDLLPLGSPYTAERRRPRGRSGPRRPQVSRGGVVTMSIAGVIGALFVLGVVSGGDDGNGTPDTAGLTQTESAEAPGNGTNTHTGPTATTGRPPRFVVLELEPTAAVWVCLEAAGDRRLLPGRVVTPTETLPRWRSSRFRMTLGNGQVVLRINGRARDVPDRSEAVGYELRADGRLRVLAESRRPLCT